ncbi:MAG: hypothetical protein JNK84_02550 [Phreatobacter sp.]|uniref:hypothetical protein n=1 Tax=Phreatobacter sp. TaxID=1966341 RepID=UPI001A60D805|nr:hypothetical protein [Phreatobacter sp.]MBL8567942.1 hypothetical protein [Phreatobacter sp.]
MGFRSHANNAAGKPKRLKPISVRVNADELARLRAIAADQPLSTYLKQTALGRTASNPKATTAQALAQLGQSELALSLRTMAAAARAGALPVSIELEAALWRACADIADMRAALLRELGVRVDALPGDPTHVAAAFNREAGSPP